LRTSPEEARSLAKKIGIDDSFCFIGCLKDRNVNNAFKSQIFDRLELTLYSDSIQHF
jgi:hypothetical protein